MTTISRRTVLRGLGTALALPWLEAMAPAAGSMTRPPVRMGFIYVPNGMHMPDWTPQGDERGFELPKILQGVESFREQMTVISGLALDGANAHGDGGGDHARSVASFLTGAHPRKTHGDNIRNGRSIDQVIAEHIGKQTKLPSLELGTEASAPAGKCDSGYSCLYTSNISWRTETSPLAKEVNPANVFERMFGSPVEFENRRALEKKQRDRLSILDFVNDEAKSLRTDLGVRDRRKLDEYLYAVRTVERQIESSEKLDEQETGVPDFPRPPGVPASYGEHVKLLLDMMALAFQTDSTRTVTMMFANAGSNRSYRNVGVKSGHHNLSHHGGAFAKQQDISKINQYHVTLLSHLLERLSQVKEGDGTLLDNCMIVYGSGIADGNSHRHINLPIALFGNGGGTINSGRHLRVRPGTPMTNLYVSMLNRAGIPIEKFSDSNGTIDDLG